MVISAPGRHRFPPVPAVFSLAGLLLLAAASFGQPEEDSRQGIFVDTIDVHLVNIEVVAVDKQGNPVTGLTRGDFAVKIDGQPVNVTNFFAVEGGERVSLVKVGEETAGTAGTRADTDDLLAARSAEELRHIVLFIDNGNIAPSHRKRVFGELREHLDHLMLPVDRVMVVAQDGEVRVDQPFTSDPEQILAAIDRQEKLSGRPSMLSYLPSTIQRKIELRQSPPCADTIGGGGENPPENPVVGGIPAGPPELPTYPNDARETFGDVSQYALEMQSATNESLQALARFVRSLAGIPGRKAVVYVSDGLNLAAGEYLFRIWDYKYGCIAQREVGIASIESEIAKYTLYDELEDLIALASSNRVAFYTIEGGSDRGLGDISAESSSGPQVQSLARTADSGREESLRALAYDTGGVPLLNSGSVDLLLTQLARDFENYYSLGFPSPHLGDGKLHRVQVEVKREGVQTRFVESYRDKSAEDRMTDQTLASLLHDVGDNPLDIQVEIGEESPVKGKKSFVVPVMVKIPMAKLVLLPQNDVHLGRLSIYIAVGDDRGRLSDPQRIEVPVRIENDQLLGALTATAGYAARIEMRPGAQKLAIGVRDDLGAVGSTLNLNLQVGGG